jgi:hypothetical protein
MRLALLAALIAPIESVRSVPAPEKKRVTPETIALGRHGCRSTAMAPHRADL